MKFLNPLKIKRRLNIQKQKRRLGKLSSFVTPLLIILVLSLGIYAVFFKFAYFNISNATVEGAKSFVSELDVLELVKSRSYGQNIIFFDSATLEDSLSKDFQGAKEIKVVKKYPKTIIIKITERTPLAIVNNENKSEHFLVDDDGYVLGLVAPDTSNFPKIFYAGSIAVGYFLDKEDINLYFKVISATDEAKLTVKSASIFENYLIMNIDGNIEVLLGKDKDIKTSIRALAGLLQQMKSQSKNVAKVDLRYDKVIVSYR